MNNICQHKYFRKKNYIFKKQVVILCWTQSYRRTHGNDSADKLAVHAISLPVNPYYQQVRRDHKAFIKKPYEEKWREKMNATEPNKLSEITYNVYLLPSAAHEICQLERCL